MATWTEKVCVELRIRGESEHVSIRFRREELQLQRQRFEEEKKDRELECTERRYASGAHLQLFAALI